VENYAVGKKMIAAIDEEGNRVSPVLVVDSFTVAFTLSLDVSQVQRCTQNVPVAAPSTSRTVVARHKCHRWDRDRVTVGWLLLSPAFEQ